MDANHLDFLEALDAHTRASPLAEATLGYDMHLIAQRAGLVVHGDLSAARWTGELIDLGYVIVRAAVAGSREPVPPGVTWSDRELQEFTGYRVTATGREEADRIKRRRRERATDVALGRSLPASRYAWLTPSQTQAVSRPLSDLQAALDGQRAPAAIGAAKDLVEAACKVVLGHCGQPASPSASLPALFAQARRALGIPDDKLGRGMGATVQCLVELRNISGAGHGRAHEYEVGAAEARLAAGFASALAEFLLSSATSHPVDSDQR